MKWIKQRVLCFVFLNVCVWVFVCVSVCVCMWLSVCVCLCDCCVCECVQVEEPLMRLCELFVKMIYGILSSKARKWNPLMSLPRKMSSHIFLGTPCSYRDKRGRNTESWKINRGRISLIIWDESYFGFRSSTLFVHTGILQNAKHKKVS